MTKQMLDHAKSFHSGYVKKSMIIHAGKEKVWRKVSRIIAMDWVLDVKKTVFLSKIKSGVGAIRKITFDDGSTVEEHVVGWKPREYFSYIAVNGLPLRAYHATISLQPSGKNSVRVIWESYLNSERMTEKEFSDFLSFLNTFYKKSLVNLKSSIES